MNTRVLLFATLTLFLFSVSAQQKSLTLKDIFSNRALYAKQIYGIQPHLDEDFFTFVNEEGNLRKWDSKGKETTLVLLTDLNAALAAISGEKQNSFPGIQWVGKTQMTFNIGNKLYAYDLKTKKCSLLNNYDEKAELIEPQTSKNLFAYTIENNIYIANNGKQIQVTNEKEKNILYGHSVHRDEFGISKGLFWSPDGNALAFYRMDQTMVTDYPLVDMNKRVAEEKPVKYPMAGMTSHQVSVGIYNLGTGKTVYMKTGEPLDQYLTCVTWSPDEKYIYIGILNRAQNHLKMNRYDATTGEFVNTLFEEKNDRYVEPLYSLQFLPDHSGRFIWLSQRDGFMHAYLYAADGQFLGQLTKGSWMITDFGGFDRTGKNMWFYATKESPVERHAYKLNIETREMVRLDAGRGTHNIIPSADLKYIIDSYSNTDVASKYQLLSSPAKIQKVLLEDINPLKDYVFPKPEIMKLKAADGTELYCRMFKPVDFDSTKKYPVLIYVYGGPHAQMITDSWTGGAGYFLPYLASKGYIVFTLDNRGSANRGLDFESVIHRHVGETEAADQMVGVDWLKSKAWVDASRIGVHGWSYGGFMTINLLTKYPDAFKMGIAGGPVIDWKFYEIMYGERYMDTPEENPEGYKNANLAARADKLKSRLLVIQGYQDATVVPQHYLTFIEASIKANKIVDQFIYPNHEHNVRGKDRLQLYQVIEQYITDHL